MTDQQRALQMQSGTREVEFYGETLYIVIAEGNAYVIMRGISDALGLDWGAQTRRLERDKVLAKHTRTVKARARDGVEREMTGLQLEYLPGWLFGVSATRLKTEEQEEKLSRYREECFQILWRALQADLGSTHATDLALRGTAALAQIRETALAVAQLAEQQIALTETVGGISQRLDQAAVTVGDLQRRILTIEGRAAVISDPQASEISQTVKALAELLTSRSPDRNFYQGIFGELYRRFGVSSYKSLPADQYAPVMQFLEDWRQAAIRGNRFPQQGSLF